MNIKKIGIASALGFLTQFAVGAVPMVLFYGPHGADMAEKFPNAVNAEPNMVIGLIGAIVFTVLFVVVLDKMGTSSIQEGAMTGAWFGAGLWFFFNTQIMAMLKVIDFNFVLVDVLISIVITGAAGAVVAFSFDRFK